MSAQLELIDVVPCLPAGEAWFLVCRQRGEAAVRLKAATKAAATEEVRLLMRGSTTIYRGSMVPDLTRWTTRWHLVRLPVTTRTLGATGLGILRRFGCDMTEVRRYAARPGRAHIGYYFPGWWTA